jgi:acyl-CoA synthetase (AMP-forming)/AMP-acid ligase II
MNLTTLLEMVREGDRDRVILGGRHDGITVEELWRRSRRGAGLLREVGAEALIYLAVNGPSYPVALFAAGYAGIPLVPLNYRLGRDQLAGLTAKHPRAAVVSDAGVQELVPEVRMSLTPEEWLARTAGPVEPARPRDEADQVVDPDAVAVVIYTSGTTSTPKGVLLRNRNLVSYVLNSVEFLQAGSPEACLVSVPPYHIAGVMNVISNVYAGRRIVVLGQFTPASWLDRVRAEGITHALVVPTMLQRLMAGPTAADLPSLRHLAYGGAATDRATVERALDLWPGVDFVNAYGLTETSSTVAVLGPEDHRLARRSGDPEVRARLGSVGRPVPGIAVEIRGDDGAVLGAGAVGRIFLRGDQISAEYAGQEPARDGGGFFDTRDEGYLDADGYLFVRGRADDTIIRGGENIAPAEIEDVIRCHPAVADVVVVGLPDQEWGHRIVAVVVPADGAKADPDELIRFTRAGLRSSKTPETFVSWPELPCTDSGKVARREIVRRLSGGGPEPAGVAGSAGAVDLVGPVETPAGHDV